jgi:hypothetical protein
VARFKADKCKDWSIFDEFFFSFASELLLHVRERNRTTNWRDAGENRARYPVKVRDEERETLQQKVGLCADCCFVRRMESDRGSIFYLCERSATDARFPKYPRLPVLQCVGYEPSRSKDKEQP